MAIGRKSGAKATKTGQNVTRQTQQDSGKSTAKDDETIEKVSVWEASGRSQPDSSRCFSITQTPHPYLPDLPQLQGELFYECTLFLYSVLALFLLYLNVYRTAWWLPSSHVHGSIKFHLVDPYLLSCIGLLLGRRVTLCFFDKISIIPPEDQQDAPGILRFIQFVLKVPMFVAVFSSFMFSFLRILQTYRWAQVLYFFGPIGIYLVTFYQEILFRCNHVTLLDANRVRHACTFSPQHIRTEANILYTDMAYRIKLAVYAAVCVLYLAVFLPYIFIPASIYIDYVWLLHWGFIIVSTSFTLFVAYLFPPQYQEMLHRASLHLGTWTHVTQNRPSDESINDWMENALYRNGAQVKKNGLVFKASGYPQGVAALPGCVEQQKLYQMAAEPLRLPNTLCAIEGFIVFIQFVQMAFNFTEWNQMLTTALVMFANYLLLFKFVKERVIIGRCYETMYKKLPTNLSSANA